MIQIHNTFICKWGSLLVFLLMLTTPGASQPNAIRDPESDGDADEKIDVQAYVRLGFKKSGFHRDRTSEIIIHVEGSNSPSSLCEILVIEDLPRDIYVDIDQVKQNRNFGDPYIISGSKIDVEKPAYLSRGHRVYIFTVAKNKNDFIKTNISFPIHLRYQRPSSDKTHVIVMLKQPRILSKCADGTLLGFGTEVPAPCDSRDLTNLCSWTELPFQVQEGAVLTFKVPVGLLQHTQLVTIGTLSSTILGTTLLLFAMYIS